MPVPYMNPYFQNNPYQQPMYNPMAPYQERLNQMQAQYNQQPVVQQNQAMSLNGEIVQSSIATVTPAATGDEFSVATEEIINAGKCPVNIAVRNPNTQTIQVSDLVVIVERIC